MKALTLTSSNHAYGFSTYATQAGFGICLLTGAVGVKSLSAILFLPVVGFILAAAGLVGLWAITVAHRDANPESGLKLEAFAARPLILTNLLLSASLFIAYGPQVGLVTHIYVLGVVFGCAVRLRQIRRDRRKLQAALEQARPADDATLAEPSTNSD